MTSSPSHRNGKCRVIQEPRSGWTPRESFSPSSVDLYRRCPRAWAERYLFGRKEKKKSWSTMLGSVIHAAIESHLRGSTVYQFTLDKGVQKEFSEFSKSERDQITKQAPQRALAGLHLLPDPRECQEIIIEQFATIDTASLAPNIEPLRFNMKLDLEYLRGHVRYFGDHKSTRDFGWMRTTEELLDDTQGILYSTALCQRYGLSEIWGRWVYFLTDKKKHPEAKCTDALFKWSEVYPKVVELIKTADEMRRVMRAFVRGEVNRDSITQNPEACGDYGGCPYHSQPCLPPPRDIVF